MKSIIRFIITFIFCNLLIKGWAAPDPNFHIYICFGQSNMQGVNRPEPEDTTCNDGFLMMATTTCGKQRTLYEWKKATISLAHCHNYLCPMSGFGKEMVELTNEEIRVGVIVVAVAGASIQLFEKENYTKYLENDASDYVKEFAKEYDYKCYERIINCAKIAQEEGVVKGILVHQGEADMDDDSWISRLKSVYEDILADLNLSSDTVPLLVGETLYDGAFSSFNDKVTQVPDSISTSHIISAEGLGGKGDLVHFSNPGYRELGKRYARTMAGLLPDSIFKEPVAESTVYLNETQEKKNPYFLYDHNTISSIEGGVSSISVYSFDGVLIKKSNDGEVDISNLSNGIYIVQAIDKSGNYHRGLFVK